ncbi:hypothetical protein [Nostoc sp. 106C]|uniref:hypothetical protein n=1 Tax=Nostoc sp. 106C TaxID=1932667 RepID=UPI000A3D3DBF|nr:hypothetical protein [Nostoc sp. 106C]OUL28798.1 hypothetical protein BV375_16910 [Nostoc sp. 106C]
MTKHDTWVKLKPGNPYEPILDLFPDGMIPMRDPFPLELSADAKVALMIIDLERLSSVQAIALAQIIARHRGATPTEVAAEAASKGGFAMNYHWVESMACGPEGFQRGKEMADFLERRTQPLSTEAWQEFYDDQHQRWISGNEEPQPINSVEDIDPRLRMDGQEEALEQNRINQMLSGYSLFDMLTGRAMVDILNATDPDNNYSLVGWDEVDEDDDIYE